MFKQEMFTQFSNLYYKETQAPKRELFILLLRNTINYFYICAASGNKRYTHFLKATHHCAFILHIKFQTATLTFKEYPYLDPFHIFK